jgi:hypothetical protein
LNAAELSQRMASEAAAIAQYLLPGGKRQSGEITCEMVRHLFDYDETTGIFKNRTTRSHNSLKGSTVGSFDKDGYVQIGIGKRKFKAHRLAWLYVFGEWPSLDIDHINGVRNDNRISNLRVVSKAQNQQSRFAAQKNNRTGYPGVSVFQKYYRARIHVNGRELHLGLYKTPELAAEAYLNAKVQYHQTGATNECR